MRNARRERGELGAATVEAETSAAARFEALTGLARTVDDKLATLAQLRVQAEQAAQQARAGREEAGLLADLTTRLLPPLASSPHKDPRAPQNLVPIGGLERELRHRLGDQQLLYRSLRAAAATWPAPTKTRP